MPRSPAPQPSATGVAFAVGAYLIWGLFPVYFKAVAEVPAIEILAHRIVWSVALLAGALMLRRRWRDVRTAFANRRLIATLGLSAAVISVNWGVFIWAVANDQILQASLGYFINPLVSVLLGVAVLGERLRTAQWTAVLLAAAGVAHQVVGVGAAPWVALILAVSFGFYGLIRKTAPIDAVAGLFVETLILSPPALGCLALLAANGSGAFGRVDWRLDGLLALAGPLTALPLILFVAGARRIRLSTVGLLQYIAPTGHFALAVFVYGEPFTGKTLVTFGCIWLALLIYTLDALFRERRG